MFGTFIKIAWRNLIRNKVYSFINIVGLALGLASAIIILLSVENDLSYEDFQVKKDVLYQVWNRDKVDGDIFCWYTTCSPLGPALKEGVPGIKQTARIGWNTLSLISYKEKAIRGSGTAADPAFLTMFTFPLLKGNTSTALSGINNIVITESFAKKVFGNEDPMGKTITYDNKEPFTVTGVLKDIPNNTSFQFEYLIPWAYAVKIHEDYPWWGSNSIQTYVELQPGISTDEVNNKIKNIVKEHERDSTTEIVLHPMKTGGRITYVRMISMIAAFILLIACINFMNLSTARSEKRAKEVGIRKVVGAERKQLIFQFLGESVFFAFIAFLLSLAIVQLLLPQFNKIVRKELFLEVGNIYYWLAAIFIILITGLLAGSYPAFYLSSFLPVKALKKNSSFSKASITPRQVLVVLQFVFSIGLIICTIIIERQLQFAKDRDPGYNKENLVYHKGTGTIPKYYPLIKHELISSGVAINTCMTSRAIDQNGSNSWGITWSGVVPDKNIIFDEFNAIDGFTDIFQLKLIYGRDLNVDKFPSDTNACLINASSLKIMGFKDPIGQTVVQDSNNYHIVGVFNDFIWGSPFAPTQPMIIFGSSFSYSDTSPSMPTVINIRFNPNHPASDKEYGADI